MKSSTYPRRFWPSCVATVLMCLLPGLAQAQAPDVSRGDPPGGPVWPKVRASLFQDRAIEEPADALLSLDAPLRAEDAAIVPIAIHTQGVSSDAARRIDKLYLIIDNNPSPIAAIFDFAPLAGRADLETRVRVDGYTTVRAVAETHDGALHMVSRFVKAAGGCSAPPGKDAQAALASLGQMRLRAAAQPTPGEPVLAQLMISHPNNSGMAMDQVTHLYTPSHFVRSVKVTFAGEPVLTADLDFAISENPNLRFYFVPRGDGDLKAEVADSHDLHFENSLHYHRSP